ncbi:ABC1 kinase family protein [Nonomuraea polychroma]|uniref:ABC1 kinase family protein n=1 Tax=Nonomuraea polychroma TaxID=46176 RepID=UPI003D8B35E2
MTASTPDPGGSPDQRIPTGRLSRVLPLAALTGRTAGEAVVAALQNRLRGSSGEAGTQNLRAAERYAEILGRSRGVLMKVGQIISFMSLDASAEGAPSRAVMQRLQSQAPPMDEADAMLMLETELGTEPANVFAEFDPRPVAAASIGQVHRARLPDGRAVAVKIQYLGVEDAIRADLANVELLTTFLRVAGVILPNMPKVDTRALVKEVAARIGDEIDYRAEADNQREFARFYHGHPFIRVPAVIDELSTRRVLTMEFADGMPWSQAVEHDQDLRDRWGEAIYRFSWGGLWRFRRIYADPHPGNFLFHPDGSVTFLDFGCVKRYTPAAAADLAAMVRAGIAGDAHGVWRASANLGSLHADRAPTPHELLDWMSEQWRPMTAQQPFTYTAEHAATVSRRLFSPFGAHSAVVRRMNMPADVLFFVRMDAGITAVLGALNATGNWKDIMTELDCDGSPATPLGRLDADFRATSRGAA